MITDKTALKYAKALEEYIEKECNSVDCSACAECNFYNGECEDGYMKPCGEEIYQIVIRLEAINGKG